MPPSCCYSYPMLSCVSRSSLDVQDTGGGRPGEHLVFCCCRFPVFFLRLLSIFGCAGHVGGGKGRGNVWITDLLQLARLLSSLAAQRTCQYAQGRIISGITITITITISTVIIITILLLLLSFVEMAACAARYAVDMLRWDRDVARQANKLW